MQPSHRSDRPTAPAGRARRWRLSGIGLRLVAMTLAATLPVMLAAIYYASRTGTTILRAGAERELRRAATTVANGVARWDHEMTLALQNLAGQPDVRSMDAAQQRPILERLAKTYDYLFLVQTAGPDGKNVCRSDREGLKNYADRDWFRGAIAGNAITRQTLISRTNNKPAVNFAVPIRDDAGRVIGVLSAVASLQELADEVGAVKVGRTGYAFVVNEAGQVVAHPEAAWVSELRDLSAFGPVKKVREARSSDGEGGVAADFADERGIRWLAQSMPAANGWNVIILQQEGEVLAEAGRFRDTVVVTTAVAGVLAVLLTWLASSRLVRPIRSLTAAADALSAGRWDRVPEDRTDELGTLAGAFNRMSSELERGYRTIEERVHQRTAELEQSNAALRRSEERFRVASQSASDVIYEWDVASGALAWFGDVDRRLGYAAGEFPRTLAAWEAALHPQDRAPVMAELAAHVRSGEPFELKYRIAAKDGSYQHWTDRGTAVREGGGTVRVIGAVTDVTRRKQAEVEREDLHLKLVAAGRKAGMAEVATGVLHNVGNVLNSVNVSASVAVDKLRSSKVDGLAKAAALLEEHGKDLAAFLTGDERGKVLPGYLAKLASHLGQEQAAVLEELNSLAANVEHIKQIVAMQQSYAKSSMVIETLDLTALIEDALRMNEAAFGRHGVRIVREYQIKPRMPVDRHRLLQVLMNLLSNAKYAMEGPGPADKRLTVRVRAAATPDRVAIEVIDVGVGIAPENLSRIFSHGFTTRKGGHGFGLHSSATALNEVGASLSAHSDGVGRGATFRIELPLGQEAGV